MEAAVRYGVLLALCAAASGCARGISLQHPEYPDNPIKFFLVRDTLRTDVSLFPGDAELLSDLSVDQTLDYGYQPPPRIRVAVMQLGREIYSTWSGHYLLVGDPLQQRLTDLLTESPRIHDASHLPEMLIPEQKSAARLRDAAALHQADLLLVFRSDCSSSYRLRFLLFRVFGASRAEGSCDVDTVLLDVRTGFVPMTSTVSKPFSVGRTSEDWNFLVKALAAQYAARSEALTEVGAQIVQFLSEES